VYGGAEDSNGPIGDVFVAKLSGVFIPRPRDADAYASGRAGDLHFE